MAARGDAPRSDGVPLHQEPPTAANVAEPPVDLRRERDQLNAILANMREGIVAIDPDGRIIQMNDRAFQLLGPSALKPTRSVLHGSSIEEVIRIAALQRLVKRVQSQQEAAEETIIIDLGEAERFLQAYASPLPVTTDGGRGVLVMIYDVTRLHYLENVRRDFVANVSHELKTPITSIKGFVETLIDGAVDNPEDARRFLAIISRQADRLNSIFEDLLSLSRIEQERDRGGIRLEERALGDVLDEALESCRYQAEERHVTLVKECPDDLCAFIHATLLEQAIVNLIDNAIKYSEPGGVVRVLGLEQGDSIEIRVTDTGKGIDKVHQPRIFERFYRVDKARSRSAGGTGLGLAIVKHIAQAHGGHASVESALGSGSTFTIHIPRTHPSGAEDVA